MTGRTRSMEDSNKRTTNRWFRSTLVFPIGRIGGPMNNIERQTNDKIVFSTRTTIDESLGRCLTELDVWSIVGYRHEASCLRARFLDKIRQTDRSKSTISIVSAWRADSANEKSKIRRSSFRRIEFVLLVRDERSNERRIVEPRPETKQRILPCLVNSFDRTCCLSMKVLIERNWLSFFHRFCNEYVERVGNDCWINFHRP